MSESKKLQLAGDYAASDKKIELTVDEIQRMMDDMDKKTFHSFTSMEWEGSIQNAPKNEDRT